MCPYGRPMRGVLPACALVLAGALGCSPPERTFAGTSATGAGGAGGSTTGSPTGVGGQGGGPGGGGGEGGAGGGVGGSGGSGGSGGGPECDQATHVCVDETPAGWTGPLALYEGPFAESPPGCFGDWGDDAGAFFVGFDPGVMTCECACGPAQNIVCNSPATLCYTTQFCNTLCTQTVSIPASGACTNIPFSGDWVGMQSPPPNDPGSCTAQANHRLATAGFALKAQACDGATTTSEGCGAGTVCAPRPTASFERLCIAQPGDVECPAGGFAEKNLVHTGFEDSRDCGPCSCEPATSTCGGDVTLAQDFQSVPCGAAVVSIPAGGCGQKGSSNQAIYDPDPSGSCAPSGGAPSGSVTTNGTVTFCCVVP